MNQTKDKIKRIREECICRKELSLNVERIVLHLMWCPQGDDMKEHNKLSWYKKILRKNPKNFNLMLD